MIDTELRELLKARPFRLFSVVTSDGAMIPIWNPEFALLSPDGRTLHAYQKDLSYQLINVATIARIQSGPASAYDMPDTGPSNGAP